jgi:hypothetical protein
VIDLDARPAAALLSASTNDHRDPRIQRRGRQSAGDDVLCRPGGAAVLIKQRGQSPRLQ